MKKVTSEEFYQKIGPLNVHQQIQNSSYPYWSLWKVGYGDSGRVVGKSVGVYKNGVNGLTETEYYLNEN